MKRKSGFTLIELLVVVAIIAVLISILLPALARAREMAKRSVCSSNLSQVGKAVYAYAQDNKEFIPWMWANYRGVPTACSTIGDYGAAAYGMSLLVAAPQGYSRIPYLTNYRVFMCPNMRYAVNPSYPDSLAALPPDTTPRYIAYYYYYVTATGQWSSQLGTTQVGYPPSMARYRLGVESPSKTCILFDEGIPNILNIAGVAYKLVHPEGWNVLYLDGHVKFLGSADVDGDVIKIPGAPSAWDTATPQVFDQRG